MLQEDEEVLAVMDLSEDGCSYSMPIQVNLPEDHYSHYGSTGHIFMAVQALYVVRNKETGETTLFYYTFWNDGTEWNEKKAEAEHHWEFSLGDLMFIHEAVNDKFD